MKITQLFTLCSLLVLGYSIQAKDMKPNLMKGKQKSQSCVACHGMDGNSINPLWPSLAGQGLQYLVKQIKNIRDGQRDIPEMSVFVANLSDQDILDISAYYSEQLPTISGAEKLSNQNFALNTEQFIKLGERIYRTGNSTLAIPSCMACHSPTGSGNAPAKYPRISGQHRKYIVKQLQDFRSRTRINDENEVMRMAVENLKDVDLEAVANYISGLHN